MKHSGPLRARARLSGQNSVRWLTIGGLLLFGALWWTAPAAPAAAISFTNRTLITYFTNTAWTWSSGSVPGINDDVTFTYSTNNINQRIYFTNTAFQYNANAFFNTTNGTVTLNIAGATANTWTLTNLFVVGNTAGSTARVDIASGVLAVTNGATTGTLIIGNNGGRGTFSLGANTVIVDKLVLATSVGSAGTLVLSTGALTINELGGARSGITC
jgi:hypothetical protein